MDHNEPRSKPIYSRRSFLKGIPLGIAAAVAVGVVSRRLMQSALGRSGPQVFPEGSIFTPAKDRKRRLKT